MEEQSARCDHVWEDEKAAPTREAVFGKSEPLHVPGSTHQKCVKCGVRRKKTFGA